MMTFPFRSIPSTIDLVDDKATRQQPDASRFAAMRTFATVGTVGLSFVFALVIGAGLGLWLDRVTGWSPLFFLLFFACGVAAGVLNVYRTFSRLPK